jgi:Protein of unknown function (DUF992)
MLRPVKAVVALAALVCIMPPALTAYAAGGVKAGYLKCDVADGLRFVIGSSRDITCLYHPGGGSTRIDRYEGKIKKFGVDIGYEAAGVMIWAVLAPTNDVGAGALAGDYAGATAAVAAGVGVGANALVGGYEKSIALQPLSVEGMTGLNVAGGIGVLTLMAAR